MDIIPAVANDPTNIITAEFIKLTVYNDVLNPSDISIYTFSSSYKYETIGSDVYSPASGYLAIGIQQRDLRATSAQTSISLSGIGPDNIALVLGTKILGSKVQVLRGFYDTNYNLTSTSNRFTGIVTSYNIQEERHDLVDNFTVTINCNSFKTLLENRISGRKTNRSSWQYFNPTDSSMNNVDAISGQYFDFGMTPGSSSGASPSPNLSGGSLQNQNTPGSRNQN